MVVELPLAIGIIISVLWFIWIGYMLNIKQKRNLLNEDITNLL